MMSRIAAALLLLAFASTGADGACDPDHKLSSEALPACLATSTDCMAKVRENEEKDKAGGKDAVKIAAEAECKCNDDSTDCINAALKDLGCENDADAKKITQPTLDSNAKTAGGEACQNAEVAGAAKQKSTVAALLSVAAVAGLAPLAQ